MIPPPIPAPEGRYDHEVAVIGYGPVGATLANLLGQAGIDTCVHERSTEPYPLPRACHLDAEIMRIFQNAGLGDEMASLAEVSRGMLFVDAEGNPLFDYEDFTRDRILGWDEDYVFIQPELDAALRTGADRFDCVEVRLGSEVGDWRELDAGGLGDPDGWLGRLLGGAAAVLIRPDRYVYGTAATPADVAGLLADARRRIGLDVA